MSSREAASDFADAVYGEKLFFNEERSKAVEGLIHLAQNSSLVVREHALTALSDIYFYQMYYKAWDQQKKLPK